MIVLQHLAMGYSNKAIGELFLSNKTVSTYKTACCRSSAWVRWSTSRSSPSAIR